MAVPKLTGLFIAEALWSNLNGDPDDGGMPRQRHDGRGWASPVSFKRKLRDLVHEKEGPVWKHIQARFNLNPERFRVLETRGRDRQQIHKEIENGTFFDHYWDARLFGATFLKKKASDGEGDAFASGSMVRTGCLVINPFRSLRPVEIVTGTVTSKAGVQEDRNQGMGPNAIRVVEHGLYIAEWSTVPTHAIRTGCDEVDLQVFLALLPFVFEETPSCSRPDVRLIHAWTVQNGPDLASVPYQQITEALKPRAIGDPLLPSTSLADYTIPTSLPDELLAMGLVLRDENVEGRRHVGAQRAA